MTIETDPVFQLPLDVTKLACSKLKIKKNKDSTFNINLSGLSSVHVSQIFGLLIEQTTQAPLNETSHEEPVNHCVEIDYALNNGDSYNSLELIDSILPSIQQKNASDDTCDSNTSELDLEPIDLELIDSNFPTIQQKNASDDTCDSNTSELLPVVLNQTNQSVEQIKIPIFHPSTCNKHPHHIVLNPIKNETCLICISEQIEDLTSLLEKLRTTNDFTEFAEKFAHLDIRNRNTPNINKSQIKARYSGAIHYQIRFLKDEYHSIIKKVFPDFKHKLVTLHKPTSEFRFVVMPNLNLHLNSPTIFHDDKKSKKILIELLQQEQSSFIHTASFHESNQSASTTNNAFQETTHNICCECFRCSIGNTLDKYNTANQEHQKCVTNTPFSHATDITKKREIQSQRQPLKKIANEALAELNAIIGKFPHVIPDPHPKQCYLKINPTDDLVSYKSIDGKFIELKIPYACSNPTENIKSVGEMGVLLPFINESPRCFHCEIKTPLRHFKSFHSQLVNNGQLISSTKQQLKLSGGRKALPKSKRREFNKLITKLTTERKTFLDSIELYQKKIFDVLSRFSHINPLPHPTSSRIATLKGNLSFSYTDVNNKRIRLTINHTCQNCI